MKIFGLGLSKTGTSSLNKALEILGYKSIHWPTDKVTLQCICRGCFKWPLLEQYDALTDIHGAAFYREFDKEYPGSKFILTVRDEQSWLKSMENHAKFLNNEARNFILDHFSKSPSYPIILPDRYRNKDKEVIDEFWAGINMDIVMENIVFGFIPWAVEKLDYDKLIRVFRRHIQEVREYFKNRSDYLEINIPAGDGWEKLCPFLGKPIPDLPFPCENVSKSRSMWIPGG